MTTALAAMLVFLSIIPFYENNQVYAYMSIDINPSIELGVNKNYEVIELIPYNEDGKKVINQLDNWKQKDVHDVAREIIHEIKTQGYMKKNHEVVIATVYEEETIDEDETRWNEEIEEIQAVLQNENLDLIVVEGTHEDRKKAKEKGLTTGLYKENIANKDKVDSKKVEKSVTVPEKQEEQSPKANLQKQEEHSIKVKPQKQEEHLPKVKPQKQEEHSPKVRPEKQEGQSLKVNEQKQKDQSAKVKPQKQEEQSKRENPQKQEEMPPKANSAKQNEKMEAKKDQSFHIPPGQLKREEKIDKNVEKRRSKERASHS